MGFTAKTGAPPLSVLPNQPLGEPMKTCALSKPSQNLTRFELPNETRARGGAHNVNCQSAERMELVK